MSQSETQKDAQNEYIGFGCQQKFISALANFLRDLKIIFWL
jgi:hypothetical protein